MINSNEQFKGQWVNYLMECFPGVHVFLNLILNFLIF